MLKCSIDSIHAKIIKTLDFEKTIKRNLQERIADLISDGKVMNNMNQNKDIYWIDLELVNITVESTLNSLHGFILSTPSPTNYTNL